MSSLVAGLDRGGARFSQTLGVVTHVPHWPSPGGQPLAYEPYVREMEIWAALFRRVEILAPVAEGALRGNQAPYEAGNIRWSPVAYSNSYGRAGQLKRLIQVPGLLRSLHRFLRASDIVLLRAPGHPALFARLLADRMGLPHITKWAGFFGPYPGERLPVRLERRLATRARWPVMVYGPSTHPHLLTFPPALMSQEELARGGIMAASREWTPPWRLFSAGRLLGVKGFDLALTGLARLRALAPDLPWHYTLVGDGPSAGELHALAKHLGIRDRVTFPGALSFETVRQCYAESHVVIMPGVKEGWPKAIAEAWAHGAVPVAAAAGLVPWILDGGHGGLTFQPTPDGLAEELRRLLSQPALLRQMSTVGPGLAAELSLETFRARLEEVLVSRCGLPPGEPSRPGRDGDRHADSGWRGAGSDHARQQTSPPALPGSRDHHEVTGGGRPGAVRRRGASLARPILPLGSRRALPVRRSGPAERHPAGPYPQPQLGVLLPTGSGPAPSALDPRGPRPSRADRKLPGHAARRPGASPRGRPLFRREREAGAIRGAFDQGAGPSVRTATQWYRRAAGPARHHDGFTIAQVARLFPEKQQLFAIEVAARLRDRKLAFQWLLIGDTGSPYADACRSAVARLGLQDQVRCRGNDPTSRRCWPRRTSACSPHATRRFLSPCWSIWLRDSPSS